MSESKMESKIDDNKKRRGKVCDIFISDGHIEKVPKMSREMCEICKRLSSFVQYFPLFIAYFIYALPNTTAPRVTPNVKITTSLCCLIKPVFLPFRNSI